MNNHVLSLIKKARKYKTAEEFIKAQGETLYRAAPDFPTDNFKKGTYFADTEQKARYYSESHYKGEPSDIKVQQFVLPKDSVFKEPSTGNYIIRNETPVKTKSQLTDIWNQAHKTAPVRPLPSFEDFLDWEGIKDEGDFASFAVNKQTGELLDKLISPDDILIITINRSEYEAARKSPEQFKALIKSKLTKN